MLNDCKQQNTKNATAVLVECIGRVASRPKELRDGLVDDSGVEGM
jgi:hypothetical protein